MAEQTSVSAALEMKLSNRPSAKDAGHGAETTATMSPKLQALAKQLQANQKRDSVCTSDKQSHHRIFCH